MLVKLGAAMVKHGLRCDALCCCHRFMCALQTGVPLVLLQPGSAQVGQGQTKTSVSALVWC